LRRKKNDTNNDRGHENFRDHNYDCDMALYKMFDFTFEYVGVVTLPEIVNGKAVEREVMVIQNLHNSIRTLRLLDLKMGLVTAVGKWRGKSRFRAFKQSMLVDRVTNSSKEGFRLEGYDGKNRILDSMDPLHDLRIVSSRRMDDDYTADDSNFFGKRAARRYLQKLEGADVFRHFLDLHQALSIRLQSVIGKPLNQTITHLSNYELSEIVMHEITARLVRFAKICHAVTIPQKWIGSSVALGYDIGTLPHRSVKADEQVRKMVIFNIFDWGRSELLTKDKYDKLKLKDKADRQKFWEGYMYGVDRLSYSAARIYYHQFTNCEGWKDVTIRVMDYDSLSPDDFIGEVTIPLPEIPAEPNKLQNITNIDTYTLRRGRLFHGTKKCGTIGVGISWQSIVQPSRLRGAWQITIGSAANLPITDLFNFSCDPYCLVITSSTCGRYSYEKMTSVKTGNRKNPTWGETLVVPVATTGTRMHDLMKAEGLNISNEEIRDLFGTKNMEAPKCQMIKQWRTMISDGLNLITKVKDIKESEDNKPVEDNEPISSAVANETLEKNDMKESENNEPLSSEVFNETLEKNDIKESERNKPVEDNEPISSAVANETLEKNDMKESENNEPLSSEVFNETLEKNDIKESERNKPVEDNEPISSEVANEALEKNESLEKNDIEESEDNKPANFIRSS